MRTTGLASIAPADASARFNSASPVNTLNEIARHLESGRPRNPRRGRFNEIAPDTTGYSLDLLDWDELNLEIDDLCARFRDAQPKKSEVPGEGQSPAVAAPPSMARR